MTRAVCLLCTAILLLGANAAWAHRVLVGAWLEDGAIVAEVGFGDGSLAAGAGVTVLDKASGEVLLQGEADDEGVYEVAVPAEVFARGRDLLVVADAGSGHRAEVTIEAAKFPNTASTDSAPEAQEAEAAELQPANDVVALDEAALRALLQETVQAEVRPLRRKIEALSNQGPGPTEIIGGIGYLLGLAGLAALLKRPKCKG